ncbi:MAG TPA: NAD(P)H-quinone oxidoreductase [Streptosporangiaceae bacterium]
MHAIVITKPGGPDVLRWQQVPDPEPGPGDVLIEIAAAGVNRADLMQRQGFYPPPPGAPLYPGLECSGTVIGTGSDVTRWQAGDRVCALLAGGGCAERVAVPQGQVLPVPAGLSVQHAAAFPEVACTVYSNVFQLARLQPGELLLVHGGGSGIGTFAIQLARAAGARVACTAGSPEKLARCRELGAEITINYRTEDFTDRIKAEGGADVILDIMGAKYLHRNIDALAANGRLAMIGMQGGTKAEIDLGLMMARRATLITTSLRARPVPEKAAVVAGVEADVWPYVAEGKIAPVIETELPITEAAEAHRLMAASGHVGKILLLTGP